MFRKGEQNFFIRKLVDWAPFRGAPNRGHLAVADLLTCGAAEIGVTTNYDDLIEQGASQLGEGDFEPSLDGVSASVARDHKPLLKIHGSVHDKDHTLWCQSQLWRGTSYGPNVQVRKRIVSARDWLLGNLAEKDLVIIGFWTDWPYLHKTLLACLRSLTPPFVVLVDKAPTDELKKKAPRLWRWAEKKSVQFQHVQEGANEFMEELRKMFSHNLLERVLLLAEPGFKATTAAAKMPGTDFGALGADDLYAIRRDMCGVPERSIARARHPDASMDAAGRVHLLLRHAGAVLDGPVYVLPDSRRVRVVNGRTKVIGQVKAEFSGAPPRLVPENIVICAGADDDGNAASNVVRGEQEPGIVRNGIAGQWMTLQTARQNGIV